MHYLPVEQIIFTGNHNFFHLVRQVVQMFQIDAIIFDANELVDHRLVSPLVEQRSDRIFLAVADQQVSGWRIS